MILQINHDEIWKGDMYRGLSGEEIRKGGKATKRELKVDEEVNLIVKIKGGFA